VRVSEKADPKKARPSAKSQAKRPKEYYRARPSGEIDYAELAKDVKKRFPKILAHLAE
jgi:hypothetical protein